VKWSKIGKIFSVDKNFGWMNTHAQIPTVLNLTDKLRVYFATRTSKTESKTTFLDLDIKDPKKILYIHDKPILNNGKPGTFDEHGIMPAGVVRHKDKIYLYYSGWSRKTSVPYNNLTGLAISDDGWSFKKISDGPILSSNIYEPYSATSPFVFWENKMFHMFYCSGTSWIEINNKYEHTYDIKYASSKDGVKFNQNGSSIVKTNNRNEAITRPVVLKRKDIYHMYYSFRGSEDFRDGKNSYKIGYAWSNDLINWTRDDTQANITISKNGWDSKMLAYPYIIETIFGTYLFYNGNGFGQSGFGFAKLED